MFSIKDINLITLYTVYKKDGCHEKKVYTTIQPLSTKRTQPPLCSKPYNTRVKITYYVRSPGRGTGTLKSVWGVGCKTG